MRISFLKLQNQLSLVRADRDNFQLASRLISATLST